jgi:DNA-binding transcriptional MerR regulator
MVPTLSRWLQLFDPPADAVYTIEGGPADGGTGLPRRTILVYCKHRLLSPLDTGVEGYSFNGDAIRSLRRIEALRTVCGDDLAGIRIILDLAEELERPPVRHEHSSRELLHWRERGAFATECGRR